VRLCFCKAMHFSHDGIVLNLGQLRGVIATGGAIACARLQQKRGLGTQGLRRACGRQVAAAVVNCETEPARGYKPTSGTSAKQGAKR